MPARMVLRVCTALGLAFVAAPGVLGQILNPRVTLTGVGSMVKADRTFVVNGRTFNTQFANGGRAKARLTLDLTKHFSVEGVYGFGTSNLKVTDLGTNPQTNAFGVKEHEVQFNVLNFFTGSGSHLRPFLVTGVGDAHFVPTDAAKAKAANAFISSPAQIAATNNVNLTLGGGFEARARGRLGLRVDVTDHISAVPTFGVPQTSSGQGGAVYPVSGIVHNIQVEAGLVIYLWRLE
ncbi:MAG TPA: hypothetical protein VN943_16595 [Candidatus Acidoferrum sp.]|nr:hypothetical protein [Candidatus Acidoferrum sp.]